MTHQVYREKVRNPDYSVTRLIPFRITRLNSKLNRQAASLLDQVEDISVAQWRILLILLREECETLSEMSELSGFDKGMLSRNIATLIDAGYIEFAREQADLRVKRLMLSEKGVTLCERLEALMIWRENRLRAELSEAEYGLLQSMLDRLEKASDDHDCAEERLEIRAS